MSLSARLSLTTFAVAFTVALLLPEPLDAQPVVRDHRKNPQQQWKPPGSPPQKPAPDTGGWGTPITICTPSLSGTICVTSGGPRDHRDGKSGQARTTPNNKGKPPTTGILDGNAGFATQGPSATGKTAKPAVIY